MESTPVNYERQLSEQSNVSADSEFSLEDYQNDIYEQLPSVQKRLQNKDQAKEIEVHWNPSQPLKMLPLCMQEKRILRDRKNLERHRIGYWASWKWSQETARRRMRVQMRRAMSKLLLWKTTLHNIEGRFGVGVKAYFVFLRYLLFLNFLNCAIIAGSVLSPTLYSRTTSTHMPFFQDFRDNGTFLDIFLGSGFMERSPVFYGFYTNHDLGTKCLNTALLFFFGMLTILLLNLIMIIRRMVVGYKNTWLTGINFNSNMSFKVFCGWDFCIREPEAAFLKHNLIRNELKMDLEEQLFRKKVLGRSLKQWILLYTLRIVLNFVVLVLLGGSIYLIHYTTLESNSNNTEIVTGKRHASQKAKAPELDRTSALQNLLSGYLSPITITVVNFVMPHFFSAITVYEDYSLTTQLNVSLVRSIVLKLGSLAIYLIFLYSKLKDKSCGVTEFGKEMYKLTIFQLLAFFCNTFLVAYPRKLLVEKCLSSNLLRRLGKQQFVIQLNVLDLVYSQTVTWVGVFSCPLLPAISIIKLVAIFYISKFNLLRCCDPARKIFRTASSSVLFHLMLLLGLIMSAISLCVSVLKSENGICGPFQVNQTLHNVTKICVDTLPSAAQEGIRYMTSEAFAFILILTEIIVLTSYVSRGQSNKKAMERLKDMLVMCSSDKRYLVKHQATLLRRQKSIKRSKIAASKQ
ncbi:transmembrane channel-like protein 7 isoform X2 [Tachysurus fulvidraco]|uniref:transmembrane channel-like protein 7 isoform X2 n=1 Tax=Tachysurus fulvidraco TaxID=1234273 RepID=UPI001FEE19B9|nr:transmembrane channel-like protein 7 isoform X2 [Tachysurus fulvidraco]